MLTVGSLFTGIGGIDLAAEWAEMEIIWQCEIDPFCQKVLQKHWPGVKLYDDIRKIRGTERPDVIVGGFPCQPYSIAGKRKGKEDDRDLWPEMFRVIQELKPTWIVGENVANFVNMELERTLLDLESEGYTTQTFIIPACSVNAKHRRNRCFVVANSGYTESQRRIQSKEGQQYRKRRKTWSESAPCSNYVAYTKRTGQQTCFLEQREIQFRGSSCGITQWKVEPKLGRVADGISDRVDRLRGLGNAVVPQQIYPILQAISDIEGGKYDKAHSNRKATKNR